MEKLIIYPDEDAIASIITSDNIITADAIILTDNVDPTILQEEFVKAQLPSIANEDDRMALAETQHVNLMSLSSILVSSIWNKNDDVFTPYELILAKDTPKFMPINWMHKGNEVAGNENIGVMVKTSLLKGPINSLEAFSADDEYDDDDLIHIRQDGVIWAKYFPSYASIIKENMEKGKAFTSMECHFSDFGYALKDMISGEIKYYIPRDKDTAHMTKSLVRYKGSGKIVYEGKEYRIGRWIKGISFTGQGIVDKPANTLGSEPLSIVIASNSPSNSVYKQEESKGNTEMNEKELQAQLEKVQSERDSAIEKLAKLEESLKAEQLETLKADLAKSNDLVTKVSEEKASLEVKVKELESANSSLESTKAELDKVSKELNEIKKIEVARTRLAELKDLTKSFEKPLYSDEDIDTIKAMSDEQYSLVKDSIDRVIKAGVSSAPKLTDQSVSSAPKLTDQSVSDKVKLTEASVKEEEKVDLNSSANTNDALPNIAATLIRKVRSK